mmetsp:Transcript_19486/g.58892  ORF Transcript_19486/g.58892 Transcript_19486/m.58892 type:complete len:201 (+) Transcript_19486:551-1153(+)
MRAGELLRGRRRPRPVGRNPAEHRGRFGGGLQGRGRGGGGAALLVHLRLRLWVVSGGAAPEGAQQQARAHPLRRRARDAARAVQLGAGDGQLGRRRRRPRHFAAAAARSAEPREAPLKPSPAGRGLGPRAPLPRGAPAQGDEHEPRRARRRTRLGAEAGSAVPGRRLQVLRTQPAREARGRRVHGPDGRRRRERRRRELR